MENQAPETQSTNQAPNDHLEKEVGISKRDDLNDAARADKDLLKFGSTQGSFIDNDAPKIIENNEPIAQSAEAKPETSNEQKVEKSSANEAAKELKVLEKESVEAEKLEAKESDSKEVTEHPKEDAKHSVERDAKRSASKNRKHSKLTKPTPEGEANDENRDLNLNQDTTEDLVKSVKDAEKATELETHDEETSNMLGKKTNRAEPAETEAGEVAQI